MLRVSEVCALDWADVSADADGSGRVTVRRSKTDQDGAGVTLYLGASTMRRVDAWRRAAADHGQPLDAGSPLFRQVRRGGHVQAGGLSRQAVRSIIRRRALDAGVEGRVSRHSLRIGAAQSLAAAGASLADMQTAGRWRDPKMPAHYARGALAGRCAVARLRHGAGA